MASNRRFSVGRPAIWGVAAVLSVGLAVGAMVLKTGGIESGVKAAERTATSTVKRQIVPELTSTDVEEPFSEEVAADLQEVVAAEVLDEHTMTVRIWTVTGTMVYSSAGEPTGTHLGDGRAIRSAAEGETMSITPSSNGGDLEIFVPLRFDEDREPVAVVELVDAYEPIVASAGQPWSLVQTVAGALAAISILMTVVSFAFLRAGRFGKGEGMGFARGGGSVDDEKMRRMLVTRDEQVNQLRAQLKEQEAETVDRIRELEIQVRDAESRIRDAEARSVDPEALNETVQEANRRAQELLDRAVRAESELSAMREQLKEMPEGGSGASDE
ncbi:MAG TPA: hypothetical protein VF108_03070, partial [Actinomycetota bacterium]